MNLWADEYIEARLEWERHKNNLWKHLVDNVKLAPTPFWERARSYSGRNFIVKTYHGPQGKPHLKLCREDQ